MTAYVVKRLQQARDAGVPFKDLAAKGEMAASVPSQVLAGDMGVGAKSRPRFARAFGFPDEQALRDAAQASWDATRKNLVLRPEQEEAIAMLVDLGQGTREQMMAILSRPLGELRGEGRQWWIDVLLPELNADRKATKADRRDRKTLQTAQGKIRKVKREKAEREDARANETRASQPVAPIRKRNAS